MCVKVHDMEDRVKVEIINGVAEVRLNRPDKMNALDPAMFKAIADAGESLKSEPTVRAVVVSAEGRGFCAGLDFSGFQAMAGNSDESTDDGGEGTSSIGRIEANQITHRGQQVSWVWQELDVPVIAAVHGVAFGGGLQVALGADIRIVSPDARLSVLEIRWGLSPDMTATQLLPRLVGVDVAKELTWTGREVSGTEAVSLGLATRVADDPRAAALEMAAEIAAKSPQAIRGGKYLINLASEQDWATGFAEERRVIGELIGSPNQVEAVTAFFEKRPAKYVD